MSRSLERVTFPVVALLIVVVVVLAGCASAGPLSLRESDAGKDYEMAVGSTLEVTLPSNPTTGYSWQVADTASGALKSSGEPRYVQDPGPAATGKGGAETLTFVGTKAGSGTLRLEYRRPWEKDVAPTTTFEVSVTVK